MSRDEARRAFVERLRAKRIALGLRQADVARSLHVGLMSVNRWELGRRFPSAVMAERWAAVLGVRVVGGELTELFRPEGSRSRCGSRHAYRLHRQRGERCATCWAARSEYNAAWQRAKRAKARGDAA